MAEERVQRRLSAIMATDVVGYSRLMGKDEAGTLAALQVLRADLIDPTISEYGGRIVKLMGDGALVEFASVVDAVECAISIQRDMAKQNGTEPNAKQIEFRIGINLGDVIIDGDDIYGDGVNVAARLEGEAEPRGICISGDAYRQVFGKIDVAFEDLGERQLKNITEPVRAYRVSLTSAPTTPANIQRQSDKPSIAFLPFENLSGDPEQEYFSDGITEDIITTLSHIRQFQVTARNSTFTYKGQSVDVRKAASELGVRYVLEGSVRKAANRVRITAQLIDGESGNHLWAERYDRDLEDIFAVQDEITQTIVAALLPELTRSEIERARKKPPENLDAWDLYQRGLWHLFRNTKDDMAAARQLFEQAIDADPGFMNPYAGILECDAHDITFGYAERDPRESFAPARKAVELDPQSAAARKALGMAHYLNRDHPSAISELKLAIQLNPNDAHIYPYLGFAQAWSGHAEEALENFLTAIRLSPHDPRFGWFHNGMGVSYLHLQRHEDCIEWVRKALQYPDAGWPIRSYLISALAHLDRMDECKQEVNALLDLHPDCTISGLQRSRLTTYQPYTDHYLAGLRKAGLPEGGEAERQTPPLPDKPSIAVLPFDNMSDDPEQEYFADGIAEDIITSLSKFDWFFVIARNSCFSYKGTSPDVRRVAEELGVRYVLEGSVRKGGNRVRITAQLVDALTGHHVWADRYDRDLEDIFAVQDEITQAIVGEVAPSFVSAEAKRVERKTHENLDAWDNVVRGNWHLWRNSREDLVEARQHFEIAIELDPKTAMALAGLAMAHCFIAILGWADDVEESGSTAIRLAKQAVDLDESNAWAYTALGFASYFSNDLDTSIVACRRALELNPNLAIAEATLSIAHSWRGDHEDALQHAERAARLSPRDPQSRGHMALAVAEFGAGHYEQAVEWAKKTTELSPNFAGGWRYLVASLAHLDRIEETRAAKEQLLRLSPDESLRRMRASVPAAQPARMESWIEGHRKAGIPE